MTTIRHAPLTPEERELAERLAQLGAPDGPPSSLDARILSAAHAAVNARAATTPRRTRWPVAVGAAATVVLAVGIAWQMRPLQEVRVEQASETADMATMRAPGPSAGDDLPIAQVATAPSQPQAPAEVSRPVPKPAPSNPTAEAAAGAVATDSAPARERQDALAAPAPAQEPPIVFDSAVPVGATPAPPAPPPPPAAVQSGVVRSQTAPAAAANASEARKETRAAEAQRARRDAAGSLDTVTIQTDAAREAEDAEIDAFSDQSIDDEPPATADSPAVQQAWLQRIRELVADGDLDGARASLGEFKRRYPRYALPDDLRKLAP